MIMSIASIPANEEQRLAALARYAILDTPPEESFDRIARIVAETIGVPIALVSLIDRDRQWFKARHGLDVAEMPRDIAFCAHAILTDDLMVIEDATQDPRFADNPLVTQAPAIRFYAGAPLHMPNGINLGTLCAVGLSPRTLSESHRQLLLDLAHLVVDEMELRIALQAALKETAEQIDLTALKNEFISVVTHELRTPLTSIRGALGMLDAGILGHLPDKAREAVAIAHRNAVNLADLVDDLLDMQKLESGRLEFEFSSVGTAALLKETCENLQALAASRRVQVETIIEEDTVIISDAQHLRQALTNLMSNAIKFSPEGGTILARVGRTGDSVRYSITDCGPGIPDAFRPHIFQKFRQAGGKNRPKGTGLGLAITKGIIDALGGCLHFDSVPGQGATFHIDLPARPTLAS